jgi:hypothetical protein
VGDGVAEERSGDIAAGQALAPEKAILEATQSGELPIDYMLRVMRDPTADDG